MNPTQLEQLSALIWNLADVQISAEKYAYYDRKPSEQAAKLSEILQVTDRLLSLLRSLDHKVGESLDDHPFDAPLVQEIQAASHVISVLGSLAPDPDDYPANVIRSLTHFQLAVSKAHDEVKPRRGNATSRDRSSVLKHHIAKNLVFRYRSMSGEFPAITKDGWAVNLLNDIFQHYRLGDDAGAYWVRREVKTLKKSIKS